MTSFAGQIAMAGLFCAMVFVVQDPASAQPSDPRDGTKQRNGVLARAVELLIADAKLLDKYNLITLNEEDKSAYQSHLSRPHPALSGWVVMKCQWFSSGWFSHSLPMPIVIPTSGGI